MFERLGALFAGPRSKYLTLAAWIVLAAVLTLTLPAVGDQENNNAPNLLEDSPSVEADAMIKQYFPKASGIPALIVWHRSEGLTEADYGLIQKVSKALTDDPLNGQGELIPLQDMPLPAVMKLASEDGTTLVQPLPFEEGVDTDHLKEDFERLQEQVKALTADSSDPFDTEINTAELSARISGPAGISVDATELFQNADFVLLMSTVLLVLILLLLIYRSPILAIIPLIGVGFAYAVTSPLLGYMAKEGWITVDSQAIAIMTVLLFGAGTDYCLFFITRFRQELQQEAHKRTALLHAFKGASGAIAMSGFTVVLSLLCLLAAHYGAFDRFAIPFSLSIFIMMIASLTLLPALMAIIGRASFFPFIPRTEEMEKERAKAKGKTYRPKGSKTTFSERIGKLVTTKPWTVVITSVIVLGIFASSATGIKYTYDLLSSFPEDMPSREGFDVIADAFTPGELAPVTVVVKSQDENLDLSEALNAVERVDHVSEREKSKQDKTLTSYTVVLDVNPYSEEAMAVVPELKAAAAEALGMKAEDAEEAVWAGGQTATQHDTKNLTDRDNSVIIPLIIGLIAVLLLIYLRSVVATIYLIATVLLSFAAALGLGWLILHYAMGAEAISGSIPLYSFVFLIALGEDYNIFMISSIWQKRKTMPLRQAIKEGVSVTGGVITSAGLILAGTFAVLASLPIQVLVQFGLITAIGVLMDTFIVRPFLVPAITTLLGKWAFWPSKAEGALQSDTEG
ncbi:MMPL family transporter [Paenibacillus sp. HB172176]|uniref:MMPL family transporter n=1 Tax=Paenibacillus sp. HB172176 TaxID=2493690 RepID=UPI0014396B60|nr:MMPL family transporter [Paenibacillus sp. HB172176]